MVTRKHKSHYIEYRSYNMPSKGAHYFFRQNRLSMSRPIFIHNQRCIKTRVRSALQHLLEKTKYGNIVLVN